MPSVPSGSGPWDRAGPGWRSAPGCWLGVPHRAPDRWAPDRCRGICPAVTTSHGFRGWCVVAVSPARDRDPPDAPDGLLRVVSVTRGHGVPHPWGRSVDCRSWTGRHGSARTTRRPHGRHDSRAGMAPPSRSGTPRRRPGATRTPRRPPGATRTTRRRPAPTEWPGPAIRDATTAPGSRLRRSPGARRSSRSGSRPADAPSSSSPLGQRLTISLRRCSSALIVRLSFIG